MKESSVVCLPGPSSSSGPTSSEEELVKTPKYIESPGDEDGDVSKTSAKEFDDSCFKTPLLPVKKTSNYQSKKKQARTNGQLKPCNGGDGGKSVPSLSQLSISGSSQSSSRQQPPKKADDHPELLDEFVSIGKHAFLCPHSRQYIACQFPSLPLKRPSNPEEDLVKEIVIDEFSLLLFASLEDYNLLKMHEEEEKEREDNEQKRKINEENLRLGKVKKKGRKSKVDLEKERKALKKKAKHERRERKRQRQEQKGLKHRDSQHPQLTPQQREERRKEKRERNNQIKQTNGQVKTPKLSKEEKQKLKEEQRRLKKEAKLELKKQKKLALKANSGVAGTSSVHPVAIGDPTEDTSASTSTIGMAAAVALNNHANPSGEMVDWHSITEIKQASCSPAGKRPASTIGIASPQKNGGVILSPTDNLHTSATTTSNTPPATKIRKLSMKSTPPVTTPEDSKPLIGIAGSSDVKKPENYNQHIKSESVNKLEDESNTNSKICTNSQPSTSRPATGAPFGQGQEHLASLQQAFLSNPDFAKNYHQSIASLRAVDASLMGIAAGAAPGGFPSTLLPNSCSNWSYSSNNKGLMQLLQLEPLCHLPNHRQHKPKSRWCCMHVTIANEIARHIEASKNPSSKAGDTKQQQQLNLQQQQQRFSAGAATLNNHNTAAASGAALSKSQLKQQQRLQQQQANNTPSSTAAAKTMQQQFNNHNTAQLQQAGRQRASAAAAPLMFAGNTSKPSSTATTSNTQQPPLNNHKLPPMLANGVPSSLAQLSALGFPLAPPQFGCTSAQAASINAALGQNPAANAQQMALQLAMLSQLGLNLPPGSMLPAPFNLLSQQQQQHQLPSSSSYANPLTSLLNTHNTTNRLLNNHTQQNLHNNNNNQSEATQNALLQAALLQGIQSLENKAAMQQQQQPQPAAATNAIDLMRQQQQLMEQSAVMQQHQQLLERFHANNQNQHVSSLLLQHQQQQQALQNGLLLPTPLIKR
uniref:Uncharacterized protein n=1 Tax=Ditylenchus dipsaci TaxID=166011 RepID=A0A915D3V6_9BILA